MRQTTTVLIGLLLSTLLTACGSGTDEATDTTSSSGNSGSTGESTMEETALKFAQCMRDNGVEEYPDPDPGSGGMQLVEIPEGVDPEVMRAAEEACKEYLPGGGEMAAGPPVTEEQMALLRKHSDCMRENGVPDWPDPNPDGSIELMNPGDPEKVQAAMAKCKPLMPQPPGS